MKLKYYLKGLGTGILFASVILSISFAVYDRQNNKKSKDDIIAAALEAGMVWPEETKSDNFEEIADTTKSDNTEKITGTTTSSEPTTPEESVTPEETTTQEEPTTSEEPTAPEETTTPEESSTNNSEGTAETNTKEPQTTVKKDYDACILYKDAEKVQIQILKGMNSYDVAIILEKAGVLKGYADKEAFNDYLVAGGYGRFVMVGVFEVPVGAAYDEIINIVCKRSQ